METVTGFILGGHKSTADGGCSHEIKRCLLLGGEEETMTNLDSVLKSRDISLSMKVHLVKAVVFPVVMYGCESWTIKKAVQFSSVAQSCPTLCDPMNRSTPGLPVHHQLLEFTQTHVHLVGDAIQPSHPLSSPSPPALNLSQHRGSLKWVSSSHQVAKVLEFQLQNQSFQWIFRTDLLYDGLIGPHCCPRDSQESSPTPQFKNQFFGAQLSSQSNPYIHTWPLEKL